MSADDMPAIGVSANDISTNEISANNIIANDLTNDDSVVSQSQNDIFIAERIVKQRMNHKKKFYLIKWKDYPESDNTWEPAENIYDKILIEIFEKEQSAESSAGSGVSKKSSKRNSSTSEKEPQKVSKSSEFNNSNNVQDPIEQTTCKETSSDITKKKKKLSSSKQKDSTLEKQLSQNVSKPSKKSNLSNLHAQTPKVQQPILKSFESSGFSSSQTHIIEINDNQNNSFCGNSMSSPPVFAHKSSPFSYGTVEDPILSQGSDFSNAPVITANTLAPAASASTTTTNSINEIDLFRYADNVGGNNGHHNNSYNLPAYVTEAQNDNISLALTINGVTCTCHFQNASFNLPS